MEQGHEGNLPLGVGDTVLFWVLDIQVDATSEVH